MTSQKLCREYIGPECFILAKGNLEAMLDLRLLLHPTITYLQLDWISMMALASKHGHGVVEYVTPSLYALVQPTRSVNFFVDRDRKSLSPAVINCIDKSNVKSIRMLGQMLSARHACSIEPVSYSVDSASKHPHTCSSSTNDQDLLLSCIFSIR